MRQETYYSDFEDDLDPNETKTQREDDENSSFDAEFEENSKLNLDSDFGLEPVFILNFNKNYEQSSRKITEPMDEYMTNNYDRIIYWLKKLSNAYTNRNKFRELSSVYSAEDFVQETYIKVLKTFTDNEKRKAVCENCTHQCKEFLNKTKKRNVEKCASGRTCRPYMKYEYTEHELNNYINKSLKQNIDNKLKKLRSKNGEKIEMKLQDKIGSSEDACELGSMLSDMLTPESITEIDIKDEFLNKKLLFINKLDNFELDPEIENDNQDLTITEEIRKDRRKVFERYGIPVPPDLNRDSEEIMKLAKHYIGKDSGQKLMSRFDLIPSVEDYESYWKLLQKRAENDDKIKIGLELTDSLKRTLSSMYKLKLDSVLTDEFLLNAQIEEARKSASSEEEFIKEKEQIQNAYQEAQLDLIGTSLPISEIEELLESESYSELCEYKDYVNGYYYELNNEELSPIEMEYTKSTEIKIVDKDYKVIPLPLCTYAEISVKDFLSLYLDFKNKESVFSKIFLNFTDNSFKEFWLDFEMRDYEIAENITWLEDSSVRHTRYRIERFMRSDRIAKKIKEKYPKFYKDAFKELRETLLKIDSEPVAEKLPFGKEFITRVIKFLKEYIKTIGYNHCVDTTVIKLAIPRRVRLSKEDRVAEAEEELKHIIELRDKIKNNETTDINASEINTACSNLTQEELLLALLEKIPSQRTQYVVEEVKVACTSHSDSLKTMVLA